MFSSKSNTEKRPYFWPTSKSMNPMGSCESADLRSFVTASSLGDIPWLVQGKKYTPGLQGLHEEIEDFYALMRHTTEENELRLQVLDKVRRIANDQWPDAVVESYGSFRSGLYLPTSDVDCTIMVKDLPELEVLTTLRKALISSQTAESTSLIHHTRIPVLKFVDKTTSINVDIVAHKNKGIETAALVEEWCKEWPVIPKLFLVLKQFLQFHRIGNVYKGGLSSYSLIIMLVCFLRLKSKVSAGITNKGRNGRTSANTTKNLLSNHGEALIQFLEFYGQEFDYNTLAIKISNGSSPFVPKEHVPNLKMESRSEVLLSIEDPLDETNNISRGTFRAETVREAFAYAANSLKHPMIIYRHFFPDAGFLGRILRIPSYVLANRAKNYNNSVNPLSNDQCNTLGIF